MGLAENIEQLSFGRSLPRMDSCLGLFLSPELIFLTEVRMKEGRPEVLHLLRLPVPGEAASKQTKVVGTLNTDFLSEPDKTVEVLQKAMSDVKWRSKHLMVTLSHHFGILRYFTLPAIDRRFWNTGVPVEAKKYIPIPFDSLDHDFQVRPVAPGPDKRPRLGSLFGVTHKKNLVGIRTLAGKLGLTLVGTEIAPCSVERLWDTLEADAESAPYAQVHFDGGHIRILVSEGGLPIFFREVILPEGASVMERRKIDLHGCIDFTRKQLGAPAPANVRISGQVADRKAWQAAFGQDTGQAVAVQETDRMLGIRGSQWGAYAAIGAGLRHLAATPLTLDLSAVGRINDEDRRAATAILALSAVVASVFLLLGGYRYSIVNYKARALSGLQQETGVYEVFRGKTASDIESMIMEMRDKANSFGALTARQIPLTKILEVLAENIPDSAWIKMLKYENPLAMEGLKTPRTLAIEGSVADQSRAMEQDIGYRFEEGLGKDARFNEAFPVRQPNIDVPRAMEGEGLPGPGAPKQEVKPTDFTIKCASAKEDRG
ncbi:MAG: hypothetical protein ABII00_00825 [Elusimicrobiota bacterium]